MTRGVHAPHLLWTLFPVALMIHCRLMKNILHRRRMENIRVAPPLLKTKQLN